MFADLLTHFIPYLNKWNASKNVERMVTVAWMWFLKVKGRKLCLIRVYDLVKEILKNKDKWDY